MKDVNYHLHARNSDTNFVFYGDIVFRPENYGRFDYVVMQEGDVINIYLSDEGREQARTYGLQFLNQKWREEKLTEIKTATQDLRDAKFLQKLNTFPSHDLLRRLDVYVAAINELGKIYILLEGPTLAGLEEKIETETMVPELLKELGRFKYDIHELAIPLMGSMYNFLIAVATAYGVALEDIMNMRIEELRLLLKGDSKLNTEEIEKRRGGFIYLPKENKICIGEEYKQWRAKLEPPHAGDIKGQVGHKGKARGTVKIHLSAAFGQTVPPGTVLVSGMTNPQMVPFLKNVVAIVTDEGGMMCHAAIISRELDIPSIVGTKRATRVLKDGDLVEVDANHGVVRILESNGKREGTA